LLFEDGRLPIIDEHQLIFSIHKPPINRQIAVHDVQFIVQIIDNFCHLHGPVDKPEEVYFLRKEDGAQFALPQLLALL